MLDLNLYASKIQKWWTNKPGCYKCGSKRLAWKYTCVYCYHDKHSDDCLACKNGNKHTF